MNARLLSFLGIARKACKISLGNDIVSESIKCGKSKLILIAADISKRTKRNVDFLSHTYGIELIELSFTMDEIQKYIGKRVGLISINDEGFAKKIKKLVIE